MLLAGRTLRFRPQASSFGGLAAAGVAIAIALVFHRLNYRGLSRDAMDLAQGMFQPNHMRLFSLAYILANDAQWENAIE